LAREFEPLVREYRFFAVGKAPDDIAICSSVIYELGDGFVKVEYDVKLAISVETGIAQIVVTQPGRSFHLQLREPLPSSLSQRLRGTVSFLTQEQQCTRNQTRLAKMFDEKPTKPNSIEPIAAGFYQLHDALVFSGPAPHGERG
jgi:hypothetical protein